MQINRWQLFENQLTVCFCHVLKIGEYKYGFLTCIFKHLQTYSGKKFNITLFTRNGIDETDYWVGTLKNVEVIDEIEARKVWGEYNKNGWLDKMRNDLKHYSLDVLDNDKWNSDNAYLLFNIKFKASQIPQIGELWPVEPGDIRSYRYTLMNLTEDVEKNIKIQAKTHGTFDESGTTDPSASGALIKRNYQSSETEIEIKHGEIQEGFMRYLQMKYGKENVQREYRSYGMSRVDIVRRLPEGGLVYYEVKSYTNLLTSLRQGIGQLLEYCLYPDVEKAEKIVLVSDVNPREDEELRTYVERIGEFMKIQFGYVCFDTREKTVVYESDGE